jgi:hypothetical protein
MPETAAAEPGRNANSVASSPVERSTGADGVDCPIRLDKRLRKSPMDVLALTKERVVALVIVVINVIGAVLFSTVSQNKGLIALSAFGLCLPGLAMIWFREALSVTGFDRGVLRESPPLFIDVIGWLFLVVLPVLFLYKLLP